MKVFIAGIDGYLGWSLAQYLADRGHDIAGCDNKTRRRCVAEVGSHSITPISSINERLKAFNNRYNKAVTFYYADLADSDAVYDMIGDVQPDTIVHLGEIPSAPYSMISAAHASFTHINNLSGTINLLFAMRDICPEAHLLKLGTMGEYGTPNIDIPEGIFEMEYRGRKDTIPFPCQPGSFYHCTKVHDSVNVRLACKIWGLRSTDIMQGVVYGTHLDIMGDDEKLLTRFDVDECFGTAINRFCASAVVEHPLTVFGAGHQARGFLPLKDSMQCFTLAIENPPNIGEYRVFNQFEAVYDLTELAHKVAKAAKVFGLNVDVFNYENPRKEAERHYYNPDHHKLLDLGYEPTVDMDAELRVMLGRLVDYKERIEKVKDVIIPDIRWDGTIRKSEVLK